MERKQTHMEKRMEKIIDLLKVEQGFSQARPANPNDSTNTKACSSGVTVKEETESENGNVSSSSMLFIQIMCTTVLVQIALLRIRSKDPYAYGLTLLHSMFTQEQLAGSLLFKSKKSGCLKPGLDPVRVEQLLGK